MMTFKTFRIFIAATFSIAACSLFAQDVTAKKSVRIEYGYIGLDNQPDYMKRLYGVQRYDVFANDKFYMITSRQIIVEGQNDAAVNKLVTTVLTDYASQKSYLCISIDTLKIKMEVPETGEGNNNLQQVLFGAGSLNVNGIKATDQTEVIDHHTCHDVTVDYTDRNPLTLMYDPAVKPTGNLAKSPFFLTLNGKYYGLILGHNQEMGPMRLYLRALKTEIDGHDESSEKVLSAYRTVSQEEGNRLIGKMLIGK
jgi:hypothetical protein